MGGSSDLPEGQGAIGKLPTRRNEQAEMTPPGVFLQFLLHSCRQRYQGGEGRISPPDSHNPSMWHIDTTTF